MNLDKYHFISRFLDLKNLNKSKEALRKRTDKGWEAISWNTFGQMATELSKQLIHNEIEVQDKVAIFSNNTPDWTISDVATMQIRAITVPIHTTESEDNIAHIINNSETKLIFVGQQEQYDKIIRIRSKCPQLKQIVVFDSSVSLKDNTHSVFLKDFINAPYRENTEEELQKRIATRNLNDLFTLVYTSGTTGVPKGVMLNYQNLAFQLYSHEQFIKIKPNDVSLAFLPLSHIFERAWSAYVLHSEAVNCYLDDSQKIREALTELQPTLMCAVPRVFEKVYAQIYDNISHSSIVERLMFSLAVRIGKKKVKKRLQGKDINSIEKKLFSLFEKKIFYKIRALLGGKLRCIPCGGAKLDPTIGLFFQAIGLNLKLGYGLTETTATVSFWKDDIFNLNSVGTILPGIKVKIGDNNEILLKGDNIMKGYYKLPQLTEEAFTNDGFFKTGDAGTIDSQGNIIITDRIKDLMKTSNGKYISPQNIERKVGKDYLIEQIMVIADGRKFVSALIVPNYEALNAFVKEMKIQYKQHKELIQLKEIQDLFYKRIQKFQKSLPDNEKIKKFTLLSNPFSIKNNEITPTQKLKRKEICQRYKKEIETMYS